MKGFRQAVEDRIASLLDRVDELDQKQYPTKASGHLLQVIREVLKRIPGQLDRYEARFREAALENVGRRESGRLQELLSDLHELAFIVNETSRAKTPAALIGSLRDTVREQTQTRVDLLIRPDSQGVQYRYEDLNDAIRKVLRSAAEFIDVEVEDLIRPLGDGVVVLSYPAAERNNVILHGVFLHEIGHHVTDRLHVVDDVVARFPLSGPLGPTRDAYLSWVWEFAADVAAARLAGPAYLFAIYQSMLATEALSTFGPSHPPSWWRVRMLQRVLDEEGFFALDAFPQAARAQIASWEDDLAAAETATRAKIASDPLENAFFAHLEQAVPHVVESARRVMPMAFTAADYERDCPPLRDQLHNLVPLNEHYDPVTQAWQPASFAAILNTGWNFVLAEFDELCERLAVHEQAERDTVRRRIFDLIAKSVEFAQIQKEVRVTRGAGPVPAVQDVA